MEMLSILKSYVLVTKKIQLRKRSIMDRSYFAKCGLLRLKHFIFVVSEYLTPQKWHEDRGNAEWW